MQHCKNFLSSVHRFTCFAFLQGNVSGACNDQLSVYPNSKGLLDYFTARMPELQKDPTPYALSVLSDRCLKALIVFLISCWRSEAKTEGFTLSEEPKVLDGNTGQHKSNLHKSGNMLLKESGDEIFHVLRHALLRNSGAELITTSLEAFLYLTSKLHGHFRFMVGKEWKLDKIVISEKSSKS